MIGKRISGSMLMIVSTNVKSHLSFRALYGLDENCRLLPIQQTLRQDFRKPQPRDILPQNPKQLRCVVVGRIKELRVVNNQLPWRTELQRGHLLLHRQSLVLCDYDHLSRLQVSPR